MKLSEFILRYRLGEGEWQVFQLPGHEIQIGRDADNHLILDHREISRHHLQIRFENERFLVTDLGTVNGTQLDGITLVPQMPTELRPGQMISMGDFVVVIARASENGIHISKELLPFLLRFRFGTGTWQTFPMEPGEKILGRDPNSDFYLNDSEVSREHARLDISEDEIWLTDLGSTNGTQVGGILLKPKQPYRLQLGQPFTIGNFILQLNEPSRFYKAPSAISGKVDLEEAEPSRQTISIAETNIDSPMPVLAMNLMSKERITIGRAADNDIVLSHPMVNRYHAVIERSNSDFRILDLNSTYGVFVNDQLITNELFLKDWDQIRIGASTFLLSEHDLQQLAVSGLKLDVKNISCLDPRSSAPLHDISLIIKPNEIVAIFGSDDSGQDRLLNALSGFVPASHGQIMANSIDFYQHYDLFRNDIGFIPDETTAHAELSVEAVLEFTAQLRLPPDTAREERTELISGILKRLDLTSLKETPVAQLTREQVKRLAIGCELLIRPRILFLANPTGELDPGAEYDMVKLLRDLAEPGHTVIASVKIGQNLSYFDKLIILAPRGYLAFFGAPEDALNYFNQYRTDQELRTKEMDFGDIYRILADEARGKPEEWQERYHQSQTYYRVFGIDPSLAELQSVDILQPVSIASSRSWPNQKISGWKQFRISLVRNFRLLLHDKGTLLISLLLAPILGLLNLIWGLNISVSDESAPNQILTIGLFGALSAVLVGILSSYRQISREAEIYQYERRGNLKVLPYYLSKVFQGILLGLYQAGMFFVFYLFLMDPGASALRVNLSLYFTFFISVLTGYLIGLLLSILWVKRSTAMTWIAMVIFLQIIFAGALLPLDWILGGRLISIFMPGRWSYEALVSTMENAPQIFLGSVWSRWLYLLIMQLGLMGVSLFTLKRKNKF